MKHVFCYLFAIILLIPAFLLGCMTWLFHAIWNFKVGYRQFLRGSQWLDEQFDYGKYITNLIK